MREDAGCAEWYEEHGRRVQGCQCAGTFTYAYHLRRVTTQLPGPPLILFVREFLSGKGIWSMLIRLYLSEL